MWAVAENEIEFFSRRTSTASITIARPNSGASAIRPPAGSARPVASTAAMPIQKTALKHAI